MVMNAYVPLGIEIARGVKYQWVLVEGLMDETV